MMKKCEICGKEFTEEDWPGHWAGGYENVCSNDCFTIRFWKQQKLSDKPDRVVIVQRNGMMEHYHMSHSDTNDYWKGFGGAAFYIHFIDGRKIKCSNLWHQGDIPETSKQLFKVNTIYFANVPAAGVSESDYTIY